MRSTVTYQTTRPRFALTAVGGSMVLFLFLSGCGKPAPEARLEAVGEALDDSTAELVDLDTRIRQTEAALERLRSERRRLRDEVRTLEQRLEARATDVALFRAVQGTLLENEDLQEAAIAVNVEDGAVTLSGVVRTEKELQQAVSIAKEVAGVGSVESKIRIDNPEVQQGRGA